MNTSQSAELRLVIIVPTKNRRALLERALESVFTQEYGAYRIIVINDCSTDDTQTYLESITDRRITIIEHKKSGGVNAARNAAFRTLQAGEWAVQLDDDDMLLPDALEVIAEEIKKVPDSIQIICFNTTVRTPKEEYTGGRQFPKGETHFDPSYYQLFTGEGLKTRGDNRPVFKWTLFPKYLFQEDINGFEGEWWLRVGRDNIGIRYVPTKTTLIDQSHGSEQLSNVAARRDPAAFVRAHERIFRDHKKFFAEHPNVALKRAPGAIKLAVRAFNPAAVIRFSYYYLHALLRNIFS